MVVAAKRMFVCLVMLCVMAQDHAGNKDDEVTGVVRVKECDPRENCWVNEKLGSGTASVVQDDEEEVEVTDSDGDSAKREIQYTAAVLEHAAYSDWTNGGFVILQENARIYLEYAAIAKQQAADIVVFPEYGLTSTNTEGGDFLALSQLVPHPSDMVVPCSLSHHTNYTQVLGDLSCGAAELGMYLVIDLAEQVPCDPIHYQFKHGTQEHLTRGGGDEQEVENVVKEPENGFGEECSDRDYIFYNTQVVLDRAGMVVARYRKKHLFLEPEFSPGTEPDSTALFSTDFGVTFSLQICFDIMYLTPGLTNVLGEGVRDVAMSIAWIDELPFLTAPQILRGWSAGLGVNLLAANYHHTASGMLGSGLFPGVTWGTSSYTYNHQGATTLIVAHLTTVPSRSLMMDSHVGGGKDQVNDVRDGGTVWVNDGGENEVGELHDEGIQFEDIKNDFKTSDINGNNVTGRYIVKNEVDRLRREGGTKEDGGDRVSRNDYVFIHEDLARYTHTALPPTIVPYSISLCHEELCCSLTYSLTYIHQEQEEEESTEDKEEVKFINNESVISDDEETDQKYKKQHKTFRPQEEELWNENMEMGTPVEKIMGEEMGKYLLLVYSGVVEKGGGVYSMFTQVCSVVYCLTDNITSCALIEDENFDTTTMSFRPIHLRARFSTPFVYPSVLIRDLTLLSEDDWSFTNNAVISIVPSDTRTTSNITADTSAEFSTVTSGFGTAATSSGRDNMNITNSSATMVSSISYDCEMFVDVMVTDLLTLVLFGRWYDRDLSSNTSAPNEY